MPLGSVLPLPSKVIGLLAQTVNSLP